MRHLLLLLPLICLTGCGLFGGGTADAYACTVKPELLAQGGACLFDDGCPCGSYCKLAACAFDCRADADCGAGKACDGFGRCVAAAAKGAVAAPLDVTPQGQLALKGVPVQLDSLHPLGLVSLTATGAAVEGAVVQAGAGVELRCTPGAAFGASCSVGPLDAGASATLAVRASDPLVDSTSEVKVLTSREALAFRVRSVGPAPVAPPPLEGVYTGYAHPVAFGSVSRSVTTPPPDTLTQVSIPVEVVIYPEVGNRRVVELSDLLTLVFPEQKTVGELLRDTGTGALQLRHPARAYVGTGTGGSAEVDVAVAATSLVFDRGTAGLTVKLRSQYSGVLDGPYDPYVLWQVSLGRVGGLPADAGAPTVPAAYVPADPVARANTPSRAETAVEAALATPLASGTLTTTAKRTQALICTPYGATAPTQLAAALDAPWSGDLGCTGATTQQAFGLLKESTWQIAPTLTRCMSDLNAGQAVAAGTASPGASAGCIDVPRAVDAIRWGLDVDRRRALAELPTPTPDATLSSLGHRLLQEWLRTHLFVARQATQVDLLNDVLASEGQINPGFKQLEMLALMNKGMELLLQPRVAMPVSRMAPDVIYTPDYRPRLAPSLLLPTTRVHEATLGLPVTIVDSVQQAIGVYGALYERARYVPASAPGLEASARDFLRKSLVLVALATMVNDSARANNPGPPAWDNAWQQKRGLYGIALAGLMRSIDDLRNGRNPLGIDDQLDLPLYRVGDQVATLARFSAVSDYLLGTGTSLDNSAIVPSRVLDAQAALTAARTAWTANVVQDYAQAQSDSAAASRLEAINRRYGEQVAGQCGDPAMNSATVLSTAASIDPDSCFLKPECRTTPAQRRARAAPGDVARILCLAQTAREKLGASATEVLATAFNPVQLVPLLEGRVTVRGHAESGASTLVTMSDGSQVAATTALFTSDSATPSPGALSQAELDRMQSRCDAVAGASEAVRPDTPPTSCTFNGDCPGGYACTGGTCSTTADVAGRTACYLGSLGELAVSIRSSVKDVEIARSELAELTQTYDLQMKKCYQENAGALAIIDAGVAHDRTIETLATVKLAADVATKTADAVAGCADSIGSDNKFGAAAAVGCGAKAVSAAAASVSAGMDFAMGQADRAHELEVQQIQAATALLACSTEAEISLVGTHSAVLRVQRAVQEVAQQLVQMENAKNTLRGALAEGQEALASEAARTVPPLALEFWLNGTVEDYSAAFRAARRAAYLGALAVEYEYQLSTIEKQNVLAATKVSDLVGVVTRLRNLVVTGTVQGRPPADLHSVVSIRANLLQLADQSALPAGWHTLTEAQRLQLLLTSRRFAVYGPDGAYLGQEVPFRVAPLSALKLGATGGVALLAGGDCSERLWSVNASLVGDGQLVVGDATRTRVTLKKRNRFFSQWCRPVGPTAPTWQLAATRPSRNLFLDPYTDYLPGGPGAVANPAATVDASAEADAFASARIAPVLNVSRADFEADQYFNGSSRELAGRGLYGDYALFFPAEFLSRAGGDGLQLGHLADILLRFDYVSVAQN